MKNDEVVKKDVWIPAPCFAKASQGIGYCMQGFVKSENEENYIL